MKAWGALVTHEYGQPADDLEIIGEGRGKTKILRIDWKIIYMNPFKWTETVDVIFKNIAMRKLILKSQ